MSRSACLSSAFYLAIVLGFATPVMSATFTLQVVTNGQGSVFRNPTADAYPQNSVVTLSAVPAEGWQFDGWSGDISGTLSPTNVLMNGNKLIAANFSAIPDYTLTTSVSGDGFVIPEGGVFPFNYVQTITAIAANGWVFHHWSGDASGSTNPLPFRITHNSSVTAVFIQPITITFPPQDAHTVPGGTASFSVVAQGTGPLTYSWLFQGAPLPNANSATLVISNAQLANQGTYQAVVSGPYHSVTSRLAGLKVDCVGTNIVYAPSDADLRAAIAIGGHVRLCFNGTVMLTNTIDVTKDVWLDASGVSAAVSGSGTLRLFTVRAGVTVGLTNLALIDGHFTGSTPGQPGGAAVFNSNGMISAVSCLFSNHSTKDADGGALASVGGKLTLSNCIVANNSVRGSVALTQKSVYGGGIFVTGMAEISDSLMVSNIIASDSTITLPGAESTAQLGGGALALQGGTAQVVRVRFISNAALGGFTRNGSIGEVGGGAIYSAGRLLARDCSFLGNKAQGNAGYTPSWTGSVPPVKGGALYKMSLAIVIGSTFAGNTCQGGNGRNTGVSTGYAGSDASGGAIYNGAPLFATNCTLYGNDVTGGASGGFDAAAGNAYGGGIYNRDSSMTLVNVTLASNSANVIRPFGNGGGGSFGANIAVSLLPAPVLHNSLIACGGTNANVWGTVIDGGYNMCSDGSANFTNGTSFNFTDPKLLPLAHNGGPTLTMALAEDSPAVDWVPAALAPAADQRGFPRPYGAAADIGAFELGPAAPFLMAHRNGSLLNVSFLGQAGVSYRLESSIDMQSWGTEVNIGILPVTGSWSTDLPLSGSRRFLRLALDY